MSPLPPSFSASAFAASLPPATLSEATSVAVSALLTPRSAAITGMSALLAARTAGPAASESTGLTMIDFTPSPVKFWSWLACCDASFCASVTVRSMPACLASACAPAFICTKKGLLSVESDMPTLVVVPEEPGLKKDTAATTAATHTAAITSFAAPLPPEPDAPDAPEAADVGDPPPARRRTVSSRTASAMTTPMTTCCQKAETDSRLRPLRSTASISAPISVPDALPTPPARLAPPMTTAAIASSSYPCAACGCAETRREARTMPATARRGRTVRSDELLPLDAETR